MKAYLLSAMLTGVLFLIGCTDENLSARIPRDSIMDENSAVVNIKDGSIYPQALEVSLGDQVVWVNNDDTSYTIDGLNSNYVIPPGEVVRHVFAQQGEYTYTIDGMQGKITVTGSDIQ